MKRIKILFPLIFLILLSGCSEFLKMTDDQYFETVDPKSGSKHLSLLFSHNINGETHPCGCRNFPLGGLPQFSGKLWEIGQKSPTIYVDTGDAFFPSTRVPESVKQSFTYTAEKLAESFDKNNLKFFVPGDQDFSLGEDFLAKISKKHKFTFLMSNVSDATEIKHQKWAHIKYGEQDLIFLGITDKSLISSKAARLFRDTTTSLKEVFKELNKKFKNLDDKKIILLSHSGIDTDEAIAKNFPQIDWIIGAHSQSYLRYSQDVGKTQLVQVLSRNHYFGKIDIQAHPKTKDKYEIVEVREGLEKLWPKNPMVNWLSEYKTKLDQIQLSEQVLLTDITGPGDTHSPLVKSCVHCHEAQSTFWQGTAHSLAYITLSNNKAANNPSCIGCHSLNYKNKKGFTKSDHIVSFEDPKTEKKVSMAYWADWQKFVATDHKTGKPFEIRSLSTKKRKSLSKKWFELDEKHKVKHNFANVQCLNCHQKKPDHPFDMSDDDDIKSKPINYQAQCIKCHTADQSPEWYNKDEKTGIATSINKKYFSKTIKTVACPKG